VSAQTTQVKPGKGRWLILDRLAVGCRRLAAGGAAWAAARDVETKRGRASAGRLLGGCLSVGFVGGTLWALSRGVLLWGSVVVGLLSAWVAGGQQQAGQEGGQQPGGYEPGVFLELLHDLAQGGNVHLVAVREQLAEETGRPWSAREVSALCHAAGIATKPVRVAGARPAVTTGVHRDDLPPLPRVGGGAPVDVVAAGQDFNNNSNNAPTVTTVGQAAKIIKHGPSIRQNAR
jgi:transposase